MKLSIAVVSWNTRDLLRACLQSLLADLDESQLEAEIIVVDNASSDGTAQMVAREFDTVRLLTQAGNLGFAAATNEAIRSGSGSYVLLLNPDTEVAAGSLSAMVRFLERESGAGAVGACLLNPDGSLQVSCYPEPTLMREFWRLFHLDRLWALGSYAMNRWDRKRPRPVDVIQGACLMVRREALNRCGLLDTEYFIYSEDVDLCKRLRRTGWKLYWLPEAQVTHHGAQSTRQVRDPMFLQLYGGKVRYFRKHHGPLHAWLYKIILAAASLSRQTASALALLKPSGERQQNHRIARQYRRLLKTLPGL